MIGDARRSRRCRSSRRRSSRRIARSSVKFAEGDIIRFTANGMTLDGHQIRNGSAYKIAGFTSDGHPPGQRLAGIQGLRPLQAWHRNVPRLASENGVVRHRRPFVAELRGLEHGASVCDRHPGHVSGSPRTRMIRRRCGSRSSGLRSRWRRPRSAHAASTGTGGGRQLLPAMADAAAEAAGDAGA